MATRQTESGRLARRVADLEEMGWRVTDSSDGYKVFSPKGRVFVIHKTISDRRGLEALEREMNTDGGLSNDEKELMARRRKQRAEKIAEGRAAVEKKTKALIANNQAMLTKAAGPYYTDAEPCDLQWMITPHPARWHRWMYVTAKAAAHVLEHCNHDNRNIREDAVANYAALMLSGQWMLTHQGVAFDTRGVAQDLQHRFLAILRVAEVIEDPDYQVPFAVNVGMPAENFKAIDEGRLRTAAQMLRKDGKSYSAQLFSIMRTITAFQQENPRLQKNKKMSTPAAFAMYDTDPQRLDEATKFAVANYGRTRISYGSFGAAYYLIGQANGFDNPYVQAFFQGISFEGKHNTDLKLPKHDPRAVVLHKFRVTKGAPVDGLIWLIMSWNNLVSNRFPSSLTYTKNTTKPRILICRPGEGLPPKALDGELDA